MYFSAVEIGLLILLGVVAYGHYEHQERKRKEETLDRYHARQIDWQAEFAIPPRPAIAMTQDYPPPTEAMLLKADLDCARYSRAQQQRQ